MLRFSSFHHAVSSCCDHQPWITPSLFDNTGNSAIVDEWTFGQLQDKNVARSALQNHWDTWITEQDFADIAAAGSAAFSSSFMC